MEDSNILIHIIGLLVPLIGFYAHFSRTKDDLERDYDLTVKKLTARKAKRFRGLFLEARKYTPSLGDEISTDLFMVFVHDMDDILKHESDLTRSGKRYRFCEKLYLWSIPGSILTLLIWWLFVQERVTPFLIIAIIWIYFLVIYIISDKYRDEIRRVGRQPLLRSEAA